MSIVEVRSQWMDAETIAHGKNVLLEVSGRDEDTIYIGMGSIRNGPLAQVKTADLFTALAEALGQRITVAKVEVIPAQTKIHDEVVYGA